MIEHSDPVNSCLADGAAMPLVNKIAIAAWGLVAACVAIWAIEMYEPDFSSEYLAVSVRGREDIRLSDVSCVSLNPRDLVFDEKQFADPRLAEGITALLSIKNVFLEADVLTCPWHFAATGISGRDSSVRYGEKFSRYQISIRICEQKDRTNSDRCVAKTIHVFNRNIERHNLLLLAIVALARPQSEEWEVYRVGKEAL
jgi:hypothetical protein